MQDKKKVGRPISVPSPWGDLYRVIGGQDLLADKLGVSRSTVTKWARNVHRVPALARKELLRLCKKHGIEEGIKNFEDV
jgi:hypothetical protein